jgi:hypothetical protein
MQVFGCQTEQGIIIDWLGCRRAAFRHVPGRLVHFGARQATKSAARRLRCEWRATSLAAHGSQVEPGLLLGAQLIVGTAQLGVCQDAPGHFEQLELTRRARRQAGRVVGEYHPQAAIATRNGTHIVSWGNLQQAIKIETVCHGGGDLRRAQVKIGKECARQ